MPHPIRAAAAAAASTLLAATAALAAPGAASAAEDDLSRLSAEEIAERARTGLRGADLRVRSPARKLGGAADRRR
ncbi:hypothetical protein [Streptomyces sp. G11C(2021)]|uniref:hypothetical protein n=1 Tax=Streptomyces sp. G11C(2021) TaxID=2841662 RepID=UPI00211493D9|nr:hypothetical protein [Streptomyces sp. G11C(2021)]UUD72059.1 hypothetical protein KNZ81_19640 [Streptomyces sp. G11C(2021)]